MAFLLLIASVFAASLPMLTFLVAVWWLDRYEREPPALVFAVFIWGAVGAIVLGVVGSGVLHVPMSLVAPQAASVAMPVLVAPLAEEPAKALIFLLLLRSRHFDGMTDGFVYGAAAGLGFGMTENFLYFAGPAASGNLGGWLTLVVARTFFSAVMHAVATSLVGAALGWARYRRPRVRILSGISGLIAAMAVHATWNGLITFDPILTTNNTLAALDVLLLVAEFALIFTLFQGCVLVESAAIRRQLLDEARRGHLAESTARTVSSWTQRTFRRWAPDDVDQVGYTGLAMRLGLRKEQATALAKHSSSTRLTTEIQGLRDAMKAAWPARNP